MTAWLKNFFNPYEADEDDVGAEVDLETPTSPANVTAPDEGDGQLALDVYQDKDNVIVKSTIAGVKPEDLDISISSDMVTVKGERRQQEEIKAEDYFYQECYWGSFSRSLNLPVEVDVDKATADLKDGILTLVLPKAARSRTKKVKIKSEV